MSGGFFGGLARGFETGYGLGERMDERKKEQAAQEVMQGLYSEPVPAGVDPRQYRLDQLRRASETFAQQGLYDQAAKYGGMYYDQDYRQQNLDMEREKLEMMKQYRDAQIGALRARGSGGAGGGKISQAQLLAAREAILSSGLPPDQIQAQLYRLDLLTAGAGKGGDIFASMQKDQRGKLVSGIADVLGSDSLDARGKLYNELIPDGVNANWTANDDGSIDLELIPDGGGEGETRRFGSLAELDEFAMSALPLDVRREVTEAMTQRARGLDYGMPKYGTMDPMQVMELENMYTEQAAAGLGGAYGEMAPEAQERARAAGQAMLQERLRGLAQAAYPSTQGAQAPRVGVGATDPVLQSLIAAEAELRAKQSQ